MIVSDKKSSLLITLARFKRRLGSRSPDSLFVIIVVVKTLCAYDFYCLIEPMSM